jgi:hypothetical protein
MAVHHFTAPDLVISWDWKPLDTFPRDGTVVEVKDAAGHVVRAFWKDDAMAVGIGSLDRPALGELTHWRHIEE